MIAHKNIDVEFKAAEDDGTFVALASVFNNVDRVGDRVLPGAFSKSLRKWRSSGKMLPIILAHQWNDIHAHIGYADPKEVRETSKGLEVKGHLDTGESETARRVHTLMKRGQLTAMSFGYTVPQGGEELDDQGVNDVSEIDLHEVGPTLVGANPKAELQSVKSAIEAEAQEEEPEPKKEPEEPESEETELKKRAAEIEREKIAADLPPELPDAQALAYGKLLESVRVMDRAEQDALQAMLDIDDLSDEDIKNLPEETKEWLTRKAEAILQSTKSTEVEDGEGEEPEKAKSVPQDPLRARSLATALEIDSAGISNRKPTQAKPPPETASESELRRQSRDLELELLT